MADTEEDSKSGVVPKMNGIAAKKDQRSTSTSPNPSNVNSRASSVSHDDAKTGSDSASTPSNGSASKLSGKASQKSIQSIPRLYSHLPDATAESCATFQVISDCLYGSKHMGSSEHDSLDCDCAEEWRK